MEEKSIQKITVSELCEASEINRSTFYNHYESPADVLKEIEMDVVNDLMQIWQENNEEKNWSINKRAEVLCSYLQDNKELSKLLLRESDINSEFASLLHQSSHIRSIYDETFAYVKSEDSKRLMITFLSNGTYHMIRQWILEDIPKTPKEIGDLVHMVATQGWEKPVD